MNACGRRLELCFPTDESSQARPRSALCAVQKKGRQVDVARSIRPTRHHLSVSFMKIVRVGLSRAQFLSVQDMGMGADDRRLNARRSDKDRRSGVDTRSVEQRQSTGERRSQHDRRSGKDQRSETAAVEAPGIPGSSVRPSGL
jgi:hypothetical protein